MERQKTWLAGSRKFGLLDGKKVAGRVRLNVLGADWPELWKVRGVSLQGWLVWTYLYDDYQN